MSATLQQARERMISQQGLLGIDCEAELLKTTAISTELTGELTPSVSCEGAAAEQEEKEEGLGDLARTLSALTRLSVESQLSLRRKLKQTSRSSRCLDTRTSSTLGVDSSNKESKQEGVGAGGAGAGGGGGEACEDLASADSPIQVVLNKAVLESDVVGLCAALKSGASPNERDRNSHSSLHFAAAKGELGCLEELMRSGARANVANNVGWSPLHYAVLGGHVSAVEALLKAGAYPCFRDNHLISPLHLASTQPGDSNTFRRIAELLGPTALLARDELEQTPLHVASSCGNRAAVSVLLDLGADPDAKDRKGRVAGQSFLRQVTRRARADIRASLAAAVEVRLAAAAAAEAAAMTAAQAGESNKGAPRAMGVTRATSTASCESAEPVRKPSIMNLLQIGGWGGGGGDGGGGGGRTEARSGSPRPRAPALAAY